MKVTILGCGGAGGVPLIGNVWGECDPANPRNRRLRSSILVEEGDQSLLVDTSPDMREQFLTHDIQNVTAILYTHAHADHCHGIDNVRSLNWLLKRELPMYADRPTMEELQTLFPYIFAPPPGAYEFSRPALSAHIIDGPLDFGAIHVTSFPQVHGHSRSRGFRFNDFGYSTDVNEMSDEAFEALKGVKVWVVGAIRERPHHSHANISLALEWIEKLGPERAYLTHMDHSTDYARLKTLLPSGVEPAYDGMIIEC